MKKLMFLTAALAMSMMPLVSCSKSDEPRDPSANLKSVDGTEWISTKGKISFEGGRYHLDALVPVSGTYKQDGTNIKFDGKTVQLYAWPTTIEEGEISKYGDRMTISFKDASYRPTGDVEKLNFVYNINKVD